MKEYILPVILVSCFIAVSTTLIKKIIWKKDEKINETIIRIIAFLLCIIGTVLSWWIFKVPSELKACILFVFPVYVFQEVFDLEVIKRIIKAVTKAKLVQQGVKDEDLEFLK